MNNLSKVISVCMIGTLVCGCARNISPNAYNARTIDESCVTYEGIIVSKRLVTVEEGDRLEDAEIGIGTGALVGGALASGVGGGNGKLYAAGAGAILGGIAGAFAEKALKEQKGFKYVVRINIDPSRLRDKTGSSNLRTVVQGIDVELQINQPVFLMEFQNGRSRVVPRF